MHSIEEISSEFDLNKYDAFIIGYPIHHTHPPMRLLKFIESIRPLEKEKPAFIFNTRGLYSANSQRILAKQLYIKNIKIIMDKEYRSPASDVSLLAPYIGFVWKFEKRINEKIDCHSIQFADKIAGGKHQYYIPRFRIYSILNAPNKFVGHHITFPIYLHKEKCVKCAKCAINCPANAQVIGKSQYPVFHKENCEKCYRCIHGCPSYALSLKKQKAPKRVISY